MYKKIIVIIPAFNEETNLGRVIADVPRGINGVSEIKIVVINDGSSDSTEKVARGKGVTVINHNLNYGVGKAMSTGVEYAIKNQADIMVNIDADGQFDPKEIGNLIKPIIEKRADFVAGNRFTKGKPDNMPIIKFWGNKLMSRLIGNIAGKKFGDVSCGFRAYSREALLNLNLFGQFTYTQEMFLNFSFKGLRTKEVPVSVKYFKDRKSKVANNIIMYAWRTASIVLRSKVYYQPLRFFGWPGIILLFSGSFFTVFLVLHRIIIGAYSPYKAFGFIGGGLMIFGLLLIFMGLLADVIDRIRINQEKLLYYEKKKNLINK